MTAKITKCPLSRGWRVEVREAIAPGCEPLFQEDLQPTQFSLVLCMVFGGGQPGSWPIPMPFSVEQANGKT